MAFKSSLKSPRVAKLEIDAMCLKGEVANWQSKAKRSMLENLLHGACRANARAAWKAVRMIFTWHELAGTAERLLAGSSAGAPVVPGDLSPLIYQAMKRAAPRINPISLQWTNQWLMRTLSEQGSPKSGYKRWEEAVMGRQHLPIFDSLPLRVYDSFCKIELHGGHLWVRPKLIREQPKGWLDLRLRLARPRPNGSRKSEKHQAMYERAELVAAGEAKLPCSQIFFSAYDRKWWFALTYDKGEPVAPPAADQLTTLFLRPARRAAFLAHYNGRGMLLWDEYLLELGQHRRDFIAARENKSRDAKKWFHYCETLAHKWACEVSRRCKQAGVNEVVVLGGRTDAAINVCGLGEEERKREATKFPVAKLLEIFSRKLLFEGVLVTTRANLRSIKRRKSNAQKRKGATRLEEAVF